MGVSRVGFWISERAPEPWPGRCGPDFRICVAWSLILACCRRCGRKGSGLLQTCTQFQIGASTVASLLPILFRPAERRVWMQGWRLRFGTGALAVALAIGMAAVQWLPTLELTLLSHRRGGTDVMFPSPVTSYLRGLLYSIPNPESDLGYQTVLGSLLVCLMASMAIFARQSRAIGHLIAVILLILLGLEKGSPVYVFLREHAPFLGLQLFRVARIYFCVAIVGMGVLAAFALDGMSRWNTRTLTNVRSPTLVAIGAAAWLAAWGLIVSRLHAPDAPWVQYAIVVAAGGGILTLVVADKAVHAPVFILALLVLECFALRLPPFHFADPRMLAKPASVTALQKQPGVRDYKLYDVSDAWLFAFFNPNNSTVLDRWVPHMLAAVTPSSNLLWGLPSMEGAFALPLQRRMDAEPVLLRELKGETGRPPGSRLIDQLGVRFISADAALTAPALRVYRHDDDREIWIMENTAALPRFRLYSRRVTVATPEEALATLQKIDQPVLVVEDPQRLLPPESPGADLAPGSILKVLRREPMHYDFKITVVRPAWLFVSDANYPGWNARIDGERVPLFSAQLLGKAVLVPAGTHEVSMVFESGTFLAGLSISLCSVLVAIILLASQGIRRVLHGRLQ